MRARRKRTEALGAYGQIITSQKTALREIWVEVGVSIREGVKAARMGRDRVSFSLGVCLSAFPIFALFLAVRHHPKH